MSENLNCSHTHATFRIWGKYLDARAVTERLGIIPSASFQRGDPGGPKGYWRRGFWAISTNQDRSNEGIPTVQKGIGDMDTGQSLAEGGLTSTDLQLHIEWLLD